jgi:hypothetical protein
MAFYICGAPFLSPAFLQALPRSLKPDDKPVHNQLPKFG